jgi:serine/threonine protein kinase
MGQAYNGLQLMPLAPGTKLGPYEIQSPLGAGGMGEVYRALDTRLNRVVAIKILAAHLSSSPELKQRLDREARAISSLNHPHICQLYDIGSQEGTEFLVMEFLEGETLTDRVKRGPLPLSEILKIGIAVAEALAVAHRHGIVHRDLKPGNIMLTAAGAKLMDFGLAKPLGVASASSSAAPPSFTAAATLSGPSPLSPLTTAGTIIGTIQYMSPEQIEGKEADARSDIFAFGAVLYEMAAGKRPFEGKSQISLASSILEKDPEPISSRQPQTPPGFEHVVETCLQKNPDDRFQTAHDIKLELQWIASGKASPAPAVATEPEPAGKANRLPWIAAVVVAISLGLIAGIFFRRTPQPASIRALINPPEKTTLDLSGDSAGPPVVSPDGSMLAFTATGADNKIALWVRSANSLEARQLADTDDATFPFWSPDSRSLAFFADGKLKTVDLNGGSAYVVSDTPLLGRGGAWGPNGVIVYSASPSSPILRINANGGTATPITRIDESQHTSHRWPFFLPDGKHFLYLAIHHDAAKSANNMLYFASIDGRENHSLIRSQSNAVYAAGYLLFARGDQLMAQPFDPGKGILSGEPRILAKGVMNDAATWHMDASAADNGLLALGSGSSSDLQLVWMDVQSKQISPLADKMTNLTMARISPRGDRAALQIDTGENDIWILDLARNVRTRLTFGPMANLFPVWSPDEKWIAYCSNRNGHYDLRRKPSDGSGAEELLFSGADLQLEPSSWSQDGKYLFYAERMPDGHAKAWVLPVEGDRKPVLVLARGAQPQISPDGRWLAYVSGESGSVEVYVVAFGGGKGKWQVSSSQGGFPKWSSDGKLLYYMDPTYNLFAVPVQEVGGALQFGAAEKLISNWSAPQVFYDVAPGGKRILLDRISQQVTQSITIITNFPSALHE